MAKKDKKTKPGSSEVNKLRQYLRAQGMTKAEAEAMVKTAYTRNVIGDTLRGWLKERPKKAG